VFSQQNKNINQCGHSLTAACKILCQSVTDFHAQGGYQEPNLNSHIVSDEPGVKAYIKLNNPPSGVRFNLYHSHHSPQHHAYMADYFHNPPSTIIAIDINFQS